MSHSSQSTCFSGASRPPHTWQAHLRHSFFSSSLQCWQDGPLVPVFRSAGGAAAGHHATWDCHPHPGTLRARPGLTLRGVPDQGASFIRELDLEDFIHEHDPAIVELRIIPAEQCRTFQHCGAAEAGGWMAQARMGSSHMGSSHTCRFCHVDTSGTHRWEHPQLLPALVTPAGMSIQEFCPYLPRHYSNTSFCMWLLRGHWGCKQQVPLSTEAEV